jgi:anti-sigma regulatory factor (Ser/Thr protein kinase)
MQLSINADLNQVAGACRRMLAAIILPVDLMAIELALTEGLNNAIIHGNNMRPNSIVEIRLITQTDAVTCVITDAGSGLCDAMLTAPQVHEDATSGRGLDLIKALANQTRIVGGNLHITFLALR